MYSDFIRPRLDSEQKKRLKALYERDNYHGLIAIGGDFTWIFAAALLSEVVSDWFLPLTLLVIGTRQRALASLLHEAAHGTLFKHKSWNDTLGRVICGWSIFQSLSAYRNSHVRGHHPKIGEDKEDPDLAFMLSEGVYRPQTRSAFIWRFLISPAIGLRIPKYVWFLIRHRMIGNILDRRYRYETIMLLAFHVGILVLATISGWELELCLYWYLPYLTSFAMVGWFSELSEHFPMMKEGRNNVPFVARNRYPAWHERLFIGTHGDNYHLTHHLLPGVPHWNLAAATKILREDPEFQAWDDAWGGIYSSADMNRISLFSYIFNDHHFEHSAWRHALAPRQVV